MSGKSLDVNYSVGGSIDVDEESLVFDCTSPFDVIIKSAGTSKFAYDSSADKFIISSLNIDLDASGNLDIIGDFTGATLTMTGFSVDADGDMIVKSITGGGALLVQSGGTNQDLTLKTSGSGQINITGNSVADVDLVLSNVGAGDLDIMLYGDLIISKVGGVVVGTTGGLGVYGGVTSGDVLTLVGNTEANGNIRFQSSSYFITPAGALTVGAITGTTLEATGRLHTLVGAAEALRLSTNATDYTGFTLDANGGLAITSVDAAAAAAHIAITADGSFAITSTAFNLSAAGALSGITSIDGTGDLTMGTITMPGFSVDADGDTTVKSLITAGLVDGVDVSVHHTAATGIHGVGTDYLAKSKTSQQYAITRVIYPHFPFASYADVGGTTCFTSRVGLATSAFETTAQTKFPKCIIKEIRFNVTLNEQNAASTITLRLNGVDTAITVSIPAITTGWFSATGTIAVAENDLISIKVVFGGVAANDFGFRGGEIVYEA